MAKERPWYDYLSELARGEHAVVDALFDIDPERAWYEHLYKPLKSPGERPTFENVLAREGMEEGWGRTIAGIAGGIAVDPVTWATLGVAPALKGGAKALQLGLRVPFVGKTTIPIASSKMAYRALKGGRRVLGALPGAETLSKLFVWAPKRLEKKFPGFLSAVRKMHGTESVETAAWMEVGQAIADDAVKIGKRLGIDADEVAKAVVDAVGSPGAKKWAPAIEDLAAKTASLLAQVVPEERAAGLISEVRRTIPKTIQEIAPEVVAKKRGAIRSLAKATGRKAGAIEDLLTKVAAGEAELVRPRGVAAGALKKMKEVISPAAMKKAGALGAKHRAANKLLSWLLRKTDDRVVRALRGIPADEFARYMLDPDWVSLGLPANITKILKGLRAEVAATAKVGGLRSRDVVDMVEALFRGDAQRLGRSLKIQPAKLEKLVTTLGLAKRAGMLTKQQQIEQRGLKALSRSIGKDVQKELAKEARVGLREQYFPRVLGRKGTEYIRAAGLGGTGMGPTLREHLPRLTGKRGTAFEIMTTNEVNRQMAEKVGGDLFIAHPGVAVFARGAKSAKAKAQAVFIGDLAAKFGGTVGDELVPEIVARIPAAKGVRFPKEIAEYVNKMITTLDSPEGSKALLRSYDKILSIWKRWTLLPFPAYHMRNAISNIANNWLIGVDTPGSYSKAMDLLRGKDVRIGTKLWKNADLIDQFARNKVFGFGFMATEGKWVPQVAVKFGAEAPTAAGRIGRLVGDNKLLAVGAKIGNNVENWARAANAIHHMDKGFDVTKAAEQVARALFNYDEVPEFISKGAVRAMPFFRWSYFNWPYQLERLAKEPGKFAKMFKTVSAIGNRIQIPPGKMPRFIVEGMGVPISEEDGKQKYALMRNWLGSAEIGEMVKPITELVTKGVRPAFRAAMQPALERLTPLVKSPVEYYSNYSLYFQSEIERYPGEKTQFMGMTLTKHQAALLRNIRILNEFDRSFPWEAVGIDRRKRVDLGNLARAIRFATGVRLYPVEKQRLLSEERWAKIRELGLARRAVKIAEKQGFPEEVERTKKWYQSLQPARKKRKVIEF